MDIGPVRPARSMTVQSAEVAAVRIGTRKSLRSDVYLNHRLYGDADGPVTTDFFFWVATVGQSSVIVDTGFSEASAEKRNLEFLLHPQRALHLLGINPLEVQHVVLTHAHYDHIGNASLFPNATFYMSESEYQFWASPVAKHTQFSSYVEQAELDYLRKAEADGRLTLFQREHEVIDGVLLREVGGHTAGQIVVHVATTYGLVVLASDALHYYEELERDMPFAVVSDLPRMYEVFADLRAARARGAEIVAGHDPAVLLRYPPHPRLPAGTGALIGGFAPP